MRDYRKTVGARLNKKGMKAVPEVEVAEADATASGLPSQQEGAETAAVSSKKKIPLETAYTEDDEELAGMSADASSQPAKPRNKPATEDAAPDGSEVIADAEGINQGYPTPKPRPKPIEVLMMAAVNMKIEPASAPPPDANARQTESPLDSNAIGMVIAAETMTETEDAGSADGKTSLTDELRNGQSEGIPTIRSITASAAGEDLFWWPQQLVFDNAKAVRRDGAPQTFDETALSDLLPGVSVAAAEPPPQMPRLAVAEMTQFPASGKGDMLVVNREGKGSLLVSPDEMAKTAENQN
jgi:hypothetical protein